MVTLCILWNISRAVSLVPLAFTLLTQAHAPLLCHSSSLSWGSVTRVTKDHRLEEWEWGLESSVLSLPQKKGSLGLLHSISYLASSVKTGNECSRWRAPFLPLLWALHHDSDGPLAIPTQTTHKLQALSLCTTNPCFYLPPTLCPHPCHTPWPW